MFIYMSLNAYILAHIRRVPTISTNGSEPYVGGQRLVSICQRDGTACELYYEYVNIIVCFSWRARFGRAQLRYTPLKKCS